MVVNGRSASLWFRALGASHRHVRGGSSVVRTGTRWQWGGWSAPDSVDAGGHSGTSLCTRGSWGRPPTRLVTGELDSGWTMADTVGCHPRTLEIFWGNLNRVRPRETEAPPMGTQVDMILDFLVCQKPVGSKLGGGAAAGVSRWGVPHQHPGLWSTQPRLLPQPLPKLPKGGA